MLSLCYFRIISLPFELLYIITAAKLRNLTMHRYSDFLKVDNFDITMYIHWNFFLT